MRKRRLAGIGAFGCAGQRCLAISAAITVGDATKPFTDAVAGIAAGLKVGNGLADGIQMGPVISTASKTRIRNFQLLANAIP